MGGSIGSKAVWLFCKGEQCVLCATFGFVLIRIGALAAVNVALGVVTVKHLAKVAYGDRKVKLQTFSCRYRTMTVHRTLGHGIVMDVASVQMPASTNGADVAGPGGCIRSLRQAAVLRCTTGALLR